MVLVTGGVASGRTAFAKEKFPDRRILLATEDRVREAVEQGTVEKFLDEVLEAEGAVVILDEPGCGITPLEASDRLFRDIYGAFGIKLAREAESVYRVFCGIGSRIK